MRQQTHAPRRARRTLVALAALLACYVLPSVALAQSGKISGRITEAGTSEPLPGATVIIDGTTQGAVADMDGYYFILNVSPGEYDLIASIIGYQSVTVAGVEVNVDRTATVDFELPSEVIEGEEVIVMAERPPVQVDRTSTEQFITDETLSRAPVQTIEEAMELQAGVHQGMFRGGNATEVVYLMDNVNLNSGLLSDNYTGVNLSSIEEISVLTGGYNAEYGNAQSAIINIVTKGESASSIGGTVVARMRPAGQYHFGRNFYSRENYDWTNFDLDYWTEASQDAGSEYYGEDPQQLLQRWQDQITPNDTLANYAQRAEYETEVTLYGPISKRLSFLASGRYKRGVNIFPQALPYNPEYNFQGKLSFKPSNKITLRLTGIYGGSESVTGSGNFNSTEYSPETEWTPPQQITDPYSGYKYSPEGSWTSWPRLRDVRNVTLEMSHVLNPATFYEVRASYLFDRMDASDRNGVIPDDKWALDQDEYDMLGFYLLQGYLHSYDSLKSQVYTLGGEITSQVTRNHQLKAGAEVRAYDMSYTHFMGAFEGGERWNLVNAFEGKPYEGNVFVQDKIEYGGLIMNAGLRLDFFHQNRDAFANMYDPLAYQSTTPGNVTPGLPGNPERVPTELQVALSPRLGFSHPITENTVLHFYYGHFYQRPAWNKMFGMPFINFTEDMSKALDPFSGVETYMDQWQGYFGNPRLGFEKTIQYEIGLNKNFEGLGLLTLTGYYKDASRQAESWTWLYNPTNQTNYPIMISNGGFGDSRGVELRVDTRLDFPLNLMGTYDISYNSGGEVGYSTMYEAGSGVNSPHGYGEWRYPWSSQHRFKGIANLLVPENFGPEVGGFSLLGDLNASAYFEWWQGQPYTYHEAGDPSTEPNNRRWFSHFRTNLKAGKGFTVAGLRSELSVEVRNLFNNKDLHMLGGDDLIRYHDREGQPLEERLPQHWWSQEPNEWGWYNVWTNPPRQVYMQLRVDF